MYLNQQDFINSLSGQTKAWATRIANIQREKHHNDGVFDANINGDYISIWLGERHYAFKRRFATNERELYLGGGREEKQLLKCAKQLADKYGL